MVYRLSIAIKEFVFLIISVMLLLYMASALKRLCTDPIKIAAGIPFPEISALMAENITKKGAN